jgi:arsenate reductase
MEKLKILFLCTGNACRSQMAEGWARHLLGDRAEVWSAGTAPAAVDPLAVEVMSEAGVDVSGHRAKHVSELPAIPFDWAITVCDHTLLACPEFPGTVRMMHHGFADPSRLTHPGATGAEALEHYRRVRDEIRVFVKTLPTALRED